MRFGIREAKKCKIVEILYINQLNVNWLHLILPLQYAKTYKMDDLYV